MAAFEGYIDAHCHLAAKEFDHVSSQWQLLWVCFYAHHFLFIYLFILGVDFFCSALSTSSALSPICVVKGAWSDCFRFFFQTFRDFGIRRNLIFFSLPLVNFTDEKCTIWKILMKMWLAIVTIINKGSCNIYVSPRISKRFDWYLKFETKNSLVMMHHLNEKRHSEKSDHASLI